jgi:hypothetical protein
VGGWKREVVRSCHIVSEKVSVTLFDCDKSLIYQCLNLNLRYFSSFIFTSVLFVESCLLISWCAGDRCGITYNAEDHGRSRRHNIEDWGWLHRSVTRWPGDRDVGWRCVQSAPCT